MKRHQLLLTMLLICTIGLAQSQSVSYPKFGGGIRFETEDNSGDIKMSARIQNLLVVDQDLGNAGNDPDVNVMTRRARLKFDGHALSPKLAYKIELGLSNRDQSFSEDASRVSGTAKIIYDAVLKYEFAKGQSIWFGQTKLPGNRERVISSQKLQFVDRSLVNSRFNLDRDVGFQLHHRLNIGGTQLRFIEAFSTGEGRNVTRANEGGLDFTGRVEFLPFGEFTNKGDYFSSDLEREQKPKLSIGITGDYNSKTIRQGAQLGDILVDTSGNFVHSDLTSIHGDLMFKYNGISVLIETAYRESSRGDYRDANGEAYRQGFGYSGQAGYLFQNNVELAARYTRVAPLKGMASDIKNEEQYTLGLSKYFLGHNLKIQTDLTYGRLLSTTFANENLMFRLQTELSF